MKKSSRIFLILIVSVVLVTMIGCELGTGVGAGGNTGAGSTRSLLDVALDTSATASLANVVVYIDANGTNSTKLATDVLSDLSADYTVFAPDNAAFVDVFGDNDGDGIVESDDVNDLIAALGLTTSAGADALFSIVAAHVAPGLYAAADVIAGAGTPFAAVQGNLTAGFTSPNYTITSDFDGLANGSPVTADIIATDVPADNGIVHLIDAVIGL